MGNTITKPLIFAVAVFLAVSCSSSSNNPEPAHPAAAANAIPSVKPAATPSNKFTNADVAKLKWIEGTWRGMDGDKPFYERYKVEDGALITETLKEDGSVDEGPERFELKDGKFGKGEGDEGSAASEITDTYVQFVPTGTGSRNSFRFEKQSDGTWMAILEWTAKGDKPAGRKVYHMERWEPKK